MNQESSSVWPSLVADTGDDFSFLELPDLDLDFPALDATPGANSEASIHASPQPATEQPRRPSSESQAKIHGGPFAGLEDGTNRLSRHMEGVQVPIPAGRAGTAQRKVSDAQLMAQYRQHAPAYHAQAATHFYGQGGVPPTPNSMEMHGMNRQFSVADHQQAQALYEAYSRKQQEKMVFTPLVSPAVTPLDHDFQMPEYAIPGEYFSPLTSPALQAQAQAGQHTQPHPQQRSAYRLARSDQSETISPVEMNFDTTFENSYATPPAKKSKRKSASTAARGNGGKAATTARAVRQSPAMKGQRRRPTSTASASQAAAAGVTPSQALKLPQSHSRQTSESADSLSPEPPLDASGHGMLPPSAPRSTSAGRSPYLTPQSHAQQPPAANVPATPASLMNIAKSGSDSGTAATSEATDLTMQGSTLPAPAMTDEGTPRLHPLNIQVDSQVTPTMSARMPAASGTAGSAASSIPPSPAMGSATSPNSGAAAHADFKVPTKGKKRNSSSQPSPALRPRISPSIKPLLPEGAPLNAETSALLLASKSNYQNILEGTHLPGVSYPDALSENLTSKRTSHKIAEQGRRNRINQALQEMAVLLPPAPSKPTSGGSDASPGASGGGGGAAAAATPQSSSKANTVELAIEYIKALQAELKDVKGRLADAEGKLGSEAA